jgi:hypothetical protein
MGQVTKDNVEDVIIYHKPDEDAVAAISRIRERAEAFIRIILTDCPNCADSSAAIRKVREAMMTANASIVLKGLI